MRATHFPPTVAVTAFATAASAAAGVGARSALVGLAVLVGQASVGWANDAWDADRDTRAGRRDKPVAAGEIAAATVFACAAVALVVDVPLSLAVGWRPGAAHLVAVGSAWLYDLRLKETVASAVPYALSFGLLPVVVATALPASRAASGVPLPQPLVVAAAATMGVAAHFANTVGDAEDDAVTGIRGLPQRLGPHASLQVAAAGIAVAAVLLVVASRAAAVTVAGAVVAVAVLPLAARGGGGGRRTAFLAVLVAVAVLVVSFLVVAADHLTRR